MSKNSGNPKGLRRFLRFRTLWKLGVVALIVVGIAYYAGDNEEAASGGTSFVVIRGNLPITVVEGGSAESNKPHHVKCEVKRRQVKILSIIEEGYRITEEDIRKKKVLVELDSGELEDRIMEQEIKYQSAKASLSKAQQDYEIQEEENRSDIEAGTRAAKFKAMELKKYLGEDIADELMKELHLRRDVDTAAREGRAAVKVVQEAEEALGETSRGLEKAEKDLEGLGEVPNVLKEASAEPNLEEMASDDAAQNGQNTSEVSSNDTDKEGALSGKIEGKISKARAADRAAMQAQEEMEIRDKAEDALEKAKKDVERASKALDEANSALDEKINAFRQSMEAARVVPTPDKAEGSDTEKPTRDSSLFAVSFELIDFASASADARLGGEAAQKRDTLEGSIMLESEELITAAETLEGTQKLYENDFVTETELKRDQMAVERRKIGLQSKTTSKELFFRYEFPKQAEEAYSAYEESLRKLERVKKEAVTKLVNSQVALDSAMARFKVQEKARADNLEQIEKCKIYAENQGLVVYGDGRGRSWQEPIREGTMVHEQMTILTIPDINDMAIKVQIHESAIKKIKKGLTANISVEAFPDEKLTGEVTKVSVLPSSENRWMNPDLKLYETTVSIDGVHDWLKPGMTAEVTIHIDELQDVLYIPLQAVGHKGGQRVCYLANGEERVVQTGEFNDKFIHILASDEGLKEGDVVLLRPRSSEEEGDSEEGDEDAKSKGGGSSGTSAAKPPKGSGAGGGRGR
jgi:multidrug resistance efflux pump